MKTEKRAQQIREKIERITADKTQVTANYRIGDNSVQAELRLNADWTIRVQLDEINFPRDLNPDHPNGNLWQKMYGIETEIRTVAKLKIGNNLSRIPINVRTKNASERRIEAKNLWLIETGKQFLTDYRAVTGKRHLAEIRKQITNLQSQQKALLPKLRESNSQYLAGKKNQREAQNIKNTEAIKSGRFWEADKDTLKSYFHPPFDKNYLADVSEKWRAALYTEMDSTAWKAGKGDWRHKNIGTGRGYLCGIDDNGDEWGHRVNLEGWMDRDQYGDLGYVATVDQAMSNLFDISKSALANCQRQGDLLFCPEKIRTEDGPEHCERCGESREKHTEKMETDDNGVPLGTRLHCQWSFGFYQPHIHKAIILTSEEKWTPRESHEITSPSLQRNGRYFRADHEIIITHTSHPTVILPAGEYRLYPLRVDNAD